MTEPGDSTLRRTRGIQGMLADIQSEVAATRSLIGRETLDGRVMNAMAQVPRDQFVPESLRAAAFANGPLPISHEQTISQPYIVALMTDLLAVRADHRILEIGTGSGYQSAVLSLLCRELYSMERIPALAQAAAARLLHLGYTNVHVSCGNGYLGWPEHAPYDGIIVTAAAPRIPPALAEQLKPGGRLVIPVGLPHTRQDLLLLNKDQDGVMSSRDILGVAFVPLLDAHPGE